MQIKQTRTLKLVVKHYKLLQEDFSHHVRWGLSVGRSLKGVKSLAFKKITHSGTRS